MLKKRCLTFIAVIFIQLTTFGKAALSLPEPSVDLRVELLSIVFRLAGNPEYNGEDNVAYVKAIHQHFDPFINHPAVRYAKMLRDSNGISYDKVMSMAVHLKAPPALTPIVPFSVELPDKRWTVPQAIKFTTLLQQFYKDAGCAAFFDAQKPRYQLAKERFDLLFKKLDASWYRQFYGSAGSEQFNIIIGLGNGGGNYGPHLNIPGKQQTAYAIIGPGSFDEQGDPTFEIDSYLPTLIHEFNHSFINYLSDLYEKELTKPGQLIFEKEGPKMLRMAYGEWKTMLNEAMVRAAVILYLERHDTNKAIIDQEIKSEQSRGFVWMPQLVELLHRYEASRDKYPTLQSFMPEVVNFYQNVSANINKYEEDYLQHCAKVVSVAPFKNGDNNVDAAVSEITFNFDKPLDGNRYFFGPGEKGMSHYPKSLKLTFSNDNKSLIMKVQLLPNTEYQISIAGSRMRTSDGYSVQNYTLDFKTGGK
ncbi:DUF4932 domain-containing protein [Mucilaginibacter sp. RS28]|uniref:DUF4932 domain-containing protein n=1 Tax=Mucilaginibacter straminoryzae TaxID=2932774 RepID=A0A9X1X625_9SPHI|nr:DUF4932 domain-containing protein [Mucilaginibacter straminoryzae]MCJ8211792.1 DUF4932 domain-containing protein [Mucilaginibacter straminoryzae]